MDRREFIKTTGMGAAALGVAACAPGLHKKEEEPTLGKMEMRHNHNSGDEVSILGYGCMRWQMIKDENGKDIVNQESVNELVDRALEAGVNYFDSSPVYLQGMSERATGIALARHPRDSYFIATKLSNFTNWTRENSMLMYQKSLEYFQTDYLDYYLLHSVSGKEDFIRRYESNGMIDFLCEERKAGRIRNLGFSFHGKKEGFDEMMEYHEKYHWDFCQVMFNYIDWHYAGGDSTTDHMYHELVKRNIPIVCMEPLRGGSLSKVPEPVANRLLEREPSLSVASWAFRFCGSFPEVLTALSGMTYREHLEDNIKTYSPLVPLTEEELEFLESTAKIMKEYPTVGCTNCKYCMPCPYGIDIPAIFAHYNKCVNEGLIVDPDNKSADQREFRKARRKYLISYDSALEKVRQADHCIGCEQCMSHCPQGIKIPHELHHIEAYVEKLRKA